MNNDRQVDRKHGDKWIFIGGIKDLKNGDVFRMWESDGVTPVVAEDGKSEFRAISEPYWSDTYDTWIIDIETKPLH